MIIMKNKILVVLTSVLMIFGYGCENYLDINNDPNVLGSIPNAEVLLPSAQVNIGNTLMGWDLGFAGGFWSEYWTQKHDHSQFKTLCKYEEQQFSTAYTNFTAGALRDLEEIKSTPGSITQLREITFKFMNYSKKYNFTTIMIGHITKDGAIAGPKVLEHMVDTVLYFEGDKNGYLRILRSIKNRFGATNEIGIFEMMSQGLKEVKNPSLLFVSLGEEKTPGSALIPVMEGTRPIMIEVQALIIKTEYQIPKRTIVGFDHKRISMLLAILDKYLHLKFATSDVFVNIVGGLKVEETAVDLGVMAALISNFLDISLPSSVAFIGEVGLNGELRGVTFIENRIKELEKLGIEEVVIAKSNLKPLENLPITIKPVALDKITDLMKYING